MKEKLKLGSLFDGSGGFPLAGSLCGIEPVWASEVEPYPIAVTRSRFPKMKHLGDISKINGAEIEPVDVITFGSPCQDLSVAGKRAGLKHEANGDEETTRSGLFMEAVRIIKEMREATNGQYPTFALWENVPGAFSSNKGEDFRIVCEELIKIVEPTASMPAVPKSGWPYADSYIGDGWSLAYRVFDAQYWGVPQRRRRIHLVLDLRGERARKVLFEREGLRGYFETGRTPWQATASYAEGSSGADDREGENGSTDDRGREKNIPESLHGTGENAPEWANPRPDTLDGGRLSVLGGTELRGGRGGAAVGFDLYNFTVSGAKAATLNANSEQSANRAGPTICILDSQKTNENNVLSVHLIQDPISFKEKTPCLSTGNPKTGQSSIGVCLGVMASSAKNAEITDGLISPCLMARAGTGGNQMPLIAFQTYQKSTGPLMANSHPGSYTGQDAFSDMLVAGEEKAKERYIVRRLTPTECARLQGFADRWGDIDEKESFTPEEFAFWQEVRNTHAAINGKQIKKYTEQQMLTWYNKLHTDSAEYKMYGNGIALPVAIYCMQGIAEALGDSE